jgi:4-hydroxy-3-polyprenylbenzoate decarboxylase
MPLELTEDAAVATFEKKLSGYQPLPPLRARSAPVMENVLRDDQVDVTKIPAPIWHELDGGKYIGTGCCVIQRDPEKNWINVGTYRVMAHDAKTLGIFISRQHQGYAIQKSYWDKGLPCPVAISLGPDPILFLASSGGFGFEWGVSEYDVAGYLSGSPVEVIEDEQTGLPIPAQSEAVLVGEIPPPQDELRPEGPFGEFTGYYASGTRPQPVVRVQAIYYRDDPILLGSPPLMPKGPWGYSFALPVKKRGLKQRLLEKGIPDVLDDCTVSIPGVAVVKIRQRDAEHAAWVGSTAVQMTARRVVIVVDEDIDIRDPAQVLWALGTRADPETAVEVVSNCKTHSLDPGVPPEKRKKGDFTTAKLIINACKPYRWIQDFPQVNRCSRELRAKVLKKWRPLFEGLEVKA